MMKCSLLVNIYDVVPQSRRILILEIISVNAMSILPTLYTPGDYSCSVARLVDSLG